MVTTADQIWGWLLIGGSAVWAVTRLKVWRRGWFYDEEEGTYHDPKSNPYSWRFLQVLDVVGFAALLYPGLASLNGWWK